MKRKGKKTQRTTIYNFAERKKAAEFLAELKKERIERAKKRAPVVARIAEEQARRIPHLDKLKMEEGSLMMQIRENRKQGLTDSVIILQAELEGLRREIERREKE